MIYLDCTTILRQDFVSGIQRILIDFATDNSKVTPIVWNIKKEKFQTLSEFPRRQMLYRSPIKRILILIVLSPMVKLGIRLLRRFRRQIMRVELFRHYASRMYAAVHVQESFGNWRALITGEVSDFSSADSFILIDIPTSKRYKESLTQFLTTTAMRKTAYVHDLIPIDHPEFWSEHEYLKVREEFSEYLDCVKHFDILIANSLYTNRRFQDYFKQSNKGDPQEKKRLFKTIYPSSKLVAMRSNPNLKKHLGQRQEKSFLMVGNFDVRKNFIVALAAFEEIQEPIVLRIVSPSNLFLDSNVQSILNRLKDKTGFEIQLFEQVPDRELAVLYSKSNFLLLPSRAEGFGIPIIEGLAYGCNVIVANNSSMSELAEKFKLSSAKTNSTSEWISLIKLAISGELSNSSSDFEPELFMPHQFQRDFMSIVNADLQDWG